jgi:hypothetical protein
MAASVAKVRATNMQSVNSLSLDGGENARATHDELPHLFHEFAVLSRDWIAFRQAG